MTDDAKIVLIAINFPPTRGGSVAVYGNIAKHAKGQILVMAPRLHYQDGLPIIGWREQDRSAGFRTIRPAQLRTVLQPDEVGPVQRLMHIADDVAQRLNLLWRILRLVRSERIAAICIGEVVPSGWLLPILKRLTRVRTASYVHGEELVIDEPYDPDHRRAARALAASDCVIAVSQFSATTVRNLIGDANAGRICVIENGVDISQFHPIGRRADLVEAYGLDGCFVYVTVCRLVEKKGVDMAIRGFAAIHARYPNTRHVVVGEGQAAAELHALAAALGVADAVIFTGDVSAADLVAHYCLGDVFVMPNRALENGDTEGFGLVFLEANACGLPAIGGRDGGTSSAVQQGVNGLLVDGHSLAEVTEAMLCLLEDEALRARIAAAALETAAAAGWEAKTRAFVDACLGNQG